MEPVNPSDHPDPQQLEKLFPFLNEPSAVELCSMIEICHIDENTCLFEAGDPCDAMFILMKGEMAVQKATGFGRNIQTIALLQIEKQAYEKFARKYPQAAMDLLHYLLSIVGLRLEKCSHRLAHIL